MFAKLYLLRHYERRLPWIDALKTRPLAGELRMSTVSSRSLGPTVQLDLLDPHNQAEAGHLATLYDPVVKDIGSDILVFRGIERLDGTGGPAGYVQEWRCELITRTVVPADA